MNKQNINISILYIYISVYASLYKNEDIIKALICQFAEIPLPIINMKCISFSQTLLSPWPHFKAQFKYLNFLFVPKIQSYANLWGTCLCVRQAIQKGILVSLTLCSLRLSTHSLPKFITCLHLLIDNSNPEGETIEFT